MLQNNVLTCTLNCTSWLRCNDKSKISCFVKYILCISYCVLIIPQKWHATLWCKNNKSPIKSSHYNVHLDPDIHTRERHTHSLPNTSSTKNQDRSQSMFTFKKMIELIHLVGREHSLTSSVIFIYRYFVKIPWIHIVVYCVETQRDISRCESIYYLTKCWEICLHYQTWMSLPMSKFMGSF